MMRRLLVLLPLLTAIRVEAATYLSKATGNFTDTATWAPVDTATASFLYVHTNNTAVTQNSYDYTANFTASAVQIDAIALEIASRAASPSGTMTVQLFNNTAGGGTEVTTVTVNISDIAASGDQGWYVFKFGSAYTPNGTDSFKIGVKTSAASQVNLYRDGTAKNWNRYLRQTAAASTRAAGDLFHVVGECTAAATCSSFTVTMDETANTSYGPTVSGGPPCGMTIGNYGTLSYDTSSGKNPYLKMKGALCVYGGGTIAEGTPGGTDIPSDSVAILEFDSVEAGDTATQTAPPSRASRGWGRASWVSPARSKSTAATTRFRASRTRLI